jgi:hypothetical protein
LFVCLFVRFEPLFFCVWFLTMQDMAFYLGLDEIGFACAAMRRRLVCEAGKACVCEAG